MYVRFSVKSRPIGKKGTETAVVCASKPRKYSRSEGVFEIPIVKNPKRPISLSKFGKSKV